MSDQKEPQDTIKEWQEWYRNHRVVAEMDEPLVSKESRENLHDTSNAISEMPNWREFFKEILNETKEKEPTPRVNNSVYVNKAIEHFADTIAEFQNEMTGEELYVCFVEAARENLAYATAEYDRAKDLFDLANNKKHVKY